MKKKLEITLSIYYMLFFFYFTTTGGHDGNNFFATYDEFSELAAAMFITVPYLIYLGLLDVKKYMADIVYFLILVISVFVYGSMDFIDYNLSDIYAFAVLIYACYAILHKLLLNNTSKQEAKNIINACYIITQFIMLIIMFKAS